MHTEEGLPSHPSGKGDISHKDVLRGQAGLAGMLCGREDLSATPQGWAAGVGRRLLVYAFTERQAPKLKARERP